MTKLQNVLLLLLLTVTVQKTNTAPGCMDNSYHADSCAPYDYKNYHYVECNCPCERFSQLYTRGKCGGCHHFRVPDDPKIDLYVSKPFASRPRVDNNGRQSLAGMFQANADLCI